jgi:hypothetical protein
MATTWHNDLGRPSREDLFHVRIKSDELTRAVELIETFGKPARRAAARALNRAAAGVRTDMSREARKEYNVRATTVRSSVYIKKARPTGSVYTTVQSTGFRTSLYEFGALPRAPRPKNPPKVGASVKVKKQTGRVRVAGSFVADMPVRGRGLYSRLGHKSSENKVFKLYGLSVPQMLSNQAVSDRICEGAEERFSKNFDHEVARMFEEMGLR